MIYLIILFIFLIFVAERFINKESLSTKSVMCAVWGVTLALASFYQKSFFNISDETLIWILIGITSFFIGGVFSRPFSVVGIKKEDIKTVGFIQLVPVYAIMLFLSYKIAIDGMYADDNFYVGIRKIINYGEPSWYFSVFGYLYYLIYPVFFISAASYYMQQSNKIRRRMFFIHGFMALFYAIASTAKVKLLMLFITVALIRSYYKKTSTKFLLLTGLCFIGLFFISLISLNKVSGGDYNLELVITSIGNYSIANIFALDSLRFTSIPSSLCINSGPDCDIMPFYNIGYFKTNVYTFIYDFFDSGILFFSLVLFIAGFIHNLLHKIAKSGGNPFIVIISSLLYFPLVYQIINNQYTSSRYLLYLTVVIFAVYFFRRKKISIIN